MSDTPKKPGLSVTRKPGQAVFIGPDITVTVTEVKGNEVTIKILAPRSTRILREELLKK